MGMIYAPPSIIPNGALINNVCHIYQSTKPTTRPDASALVVGDKWYDNTLDQLKETFWNGLYWVGQHFILSSPRVFNPGVDNINMMNVPGNSRYLLLESFGISTRRAAGLVYDASNFHVVTLKRVLNGNNSSNWTPSISITLSTNMTSVPEYFTVYTKTDPNLVIDTIDGSRSFQLSIETTGTLGGVSDIAYWLKLREIY